MTYVVLLKTCTWIIFEKWPPDSSLAHKHLVLSQSNDTQLEFKEGKLATQDNVPCSAASPLKLRKHIYKPVTEAPLPSVASSPSMRHIGLSVSMWFSGGIKDKPRLWLGFIKTTEVNRNVWGWRIINRIDYCSRVKGVCFIVNTCGLFCLTDSVWLYDCLF